MKSQKNFLILLSILILLAVLNACDRTGLSDNTAVTGMPQNEPTVSALLDSLGFQSLSGPVAPPDFTLQSIEGEEVSLSRHRGKVVLLGFWTTW